MKVLYFDRIDASEDNDVNKNKQIKKKVIFITTGIF